MALLVRCCWMRGIVVAGSKIGGLGGGCHGDGRR